MAYFFCVFVVFLSLFWMGLNVVKKLIMSWDRSVTCLIGKTVIVTGANTGIGYYTAQDFAKRGAKVILACRNKEKAEQARKNIIESTNNQNVIVRVLDFASLSSVREFVKEINETEERLDILVNNAGAGWLGDTISEDGLNLLIQINHFGPFLLTNLLIELLIKSTPSRIVNVSSSASSLAKLNPNKLNAFPTGRLGKLTNYANSKLLNILFTNELAKRLRGTGVTANSLHPGAVLTDLFRDFPNVARQIFVATAKLFFKTAEEGAQTSIYVAVSKDLNGISGEYYDNCRIAWFPGMPKVAKNEEITKLIWEKSEECVKLTISERKL